MNTVKKIIIFILILSMVTSSFVVPAGAAYEFITVNEISVDKKTGIPEDKMKISVDVEGNLSTINSVEVIYIMPLSEDYYNLFLTYNSETGKYEGEIEVEDFFENGLWKLNRITIECNDGNTYMFEDYPSYPSIDLSGGHFTIENAANEVDKPQFFSVTVDKKTVGPSNKVKISVDARDGRTGIESVKVNYRKPITKDDYEISLKHNSETGLYEGEIEITEYLENGLWSLNSIRIKNNANRETVILNKKFISSGWDLTSGEFRVEGTTPDYTNPNFYTISVNKSMVFPGDKVLLSVQAYDYQSGIKSVSINLISPSNKNEELILNYNDVKRNYEGYIEIDDQAEVGLWKIDSVTVVDNASNVDIVTEAYLEHANFSVGELIPPEMPVVNEVTDQSYYVTGTAEPNATIRLKIGESIWDGAVTSEGDFAMGITLQKAGTKITVTAIDECGNESEANTVTVTDVTAPEISGVNAVTDQSTNVKGTTEAGCTVVIKAGTKEIGTGVVNADGHFAIVIPKQPAGTELTLTVVDAAGNESQPCIINVQDVTAPEKPKVNEVTNYSSSVTGEAEPGSLILVKVGTEVIGAWETNADGSFTIPIPQQPAGTKLTITAKDAAENESEAVTIQIIEIDMTAPQIPIVDEVSDKSTTVTGTAEVGSKIVIKAGSTEVWKGETNSDGKFTITIPKQVAGTILKITATDAAGNESDVGFITVIDKTAPKAPNVDEVNDKSTSVTGTAEVGSIVFVLVGEKNIGSSGTDANGKFIVTIPKQAAGTELTVIVEDASINKSEAKIITVQDATAPEIPAANVVTDKSTTVTGTAEAGSAIEIKVGTTKIGTGKTNADGNFTIKIPVQVAGTELIIIATDVAGNVSKAKIITVKDVTAPQIPTVNEVNDKSTTVTGTAEAGSIIEVKVGTKTIGTGKTNADGKFTVTIPKQKAGMKVTIRAIDRSGNRSEAKTITVKDVTAPSLTLNQVSDKSTTISGMTEAKAQVKLYINGKLNQTKIADAKGAYHFNINKQKAGVTIKVISSDNVGNAITKSSVVVDKTAPKLVINKVSDKDRTITGSSEAKATIKLYFGGKYQKTVTADAKGNYSFKINKQKAHVAIMVIASDRAGNVTRKYETVLDKTPPSLSINTISDKSTSIMGRTEAKAEVDLYVNGKFKLTTTANTKGVYTFSISKQKAGVKIKVIASDSFGNKSTKSTTVLDKTPPAKPTVNKVTKTSKKVTGKAEKNATVYVYRGKTKLGSAKVNSKGSYSVKISRQKRGTKITVYVKDKAGNKSQSRMISVN